MRPVDKGLPPRIYVDASDAQPDLVARLGRFCSYCDRFIAAAVHVEHKQPKHRHPGAALVWTNFLLACPNCNSCKGHPRIRLKRYLWPDRDNTLRAFEYMPGGIVRASRAVPRCVRRKANRTIQLYGLDKVPGGQVPPSDRDFRWQDRREQWDKAQTARLQLGEWDSPRQRNLIVSAATNGMFSVWWTVFAGDVDMRRRLRQAFLGTDTTSFDVTENAIVRPGGQC